MPGRPPTIRERRLASELRRLRECAALTLDEAAAQLDWSKTKLSRIETSLRRVTASEVDKILSVYRVVENRREALVEFARTSRQRGWWDAYANTLPTDYATYIGLEAEAEALSAYSMGVVHGLLQTEEYARHVMKSVLMRFSPPAEVDRRVAVRMARQAALVEREPPLRLWAIIDEAALRRLVGDKEVMRSQYAHLVKMAELPNVMIQVMPVEAGVHPGLGCPFSIIEFPEHSTPNTVYVESVTAALYVEDEREVHTYTLAFEQMQASALSPQESVAMLERLAQE